MDLAGASLKPGSDVIQYRLHSRCNQRWMLEKNRDGDAYMIISVRSKMCLTIKGDKSKGGAPIVQDSPSNALGQQWILSHQGLSLYIIESKLKKGLFLGVRYNSMEQDACLVLTTKEEYAFWRVIGTFSLRE